MILSQGENQMKIKIISVYLIPLVSALILQAQQPKAAGNCSPACDPNTTCVGINCLPNLAIPPQNASIIDPKTCSVFGGNVTCDLPRYDANDGVRSTDEIAAQAGLRVSVLIDGVDNTRAKRGTKLAYPHRAQLTK
jgi:hypothetical protein